MNNAELADALAAANGLTKADARKAVDAVFAAITDAAAKGEEISINGFGKFKVKATPEREARNPAGAPRHLWSAMAASRSFDRSLPTAPSW